jgi:hypothetical protein
MESAIRVSDLIKKKKGKGFHSKEHGMEEMEPEEAMKTSESLETYKPKAGGLGGLSAIKPELGELGTIKSTSKKYEPSIKSAMSAEDGALSDLILKSSAAPMKGGNELLKKAKQVSEMAPKSEEEAKKHQKLMESIKAYEEQLKKLQGK